jgi:hypothetical protein
MNKILSNTGISSGSLIEAHHVSQSIDALTGADGYDITISGSLTVTGSVYFNSIPSNSGYNNVLTIDSTKILYTSSLDITVNNALTASYVNLVAGDGITINQVGTSFEISSSAVTGVTLTDFNNFTSSYNTGSFTGSFTGSLTGTASYINLLEGPNIDINQTGNVFAISGSSSVNTGSFLITASISSNIITFTKGDNSTFPIPLPDLSAPTSSLLLNQFYIDGLDSKFQIPSGNCILYYNSTVYVTLANLIIYLPTSSFFLGDTLEFIFRFAPTITRPAANMRISQTSSQQILSDSFFLYNNATFASPQADTTVGSTGYLEYLGIDGDRYIYGNRFTLTCVETSSIDTNYARWILSYNISGYNNYIGESFTPDLDFIFH